MFRQFLRINQSLKLLENLKCIKREKISCSTNNFTLFEKQANRNLFPLHSTCLADEKISNKFNINLASLCRLPPFNVTNTTTIIPWRYPLPVEIVDEPKVNWDVIDPTSKENSIKKEAARLIVIRRRKMKKHQLKKLRKRMRFEWAKIRLRREQRKEKAFQSELLAKLKDAEMFNAEAWVKDILQRSNHYAKKKEEEEFYKTEEGHKLQMILKREARYVKPADWKD